MSDFLNKYPYTDFHELNLDWVIERVKKLTEDWLATQQEWNDTEEQWQQLHDYVMDYFANLNVQDEINNKINAMVADGTFLNIIRSTVEAQTATTTTSWLADHITQPTTPVVDNTLMIQGAAADSAATGLFTAPVYDATVIYHFADMVNHNGKLYQCIYNMTAAESWDITHWIEICMSEPVNHLYFGLYPMLSDYSKTFSPALLIEDLNNITIDNDSNATSITSTQRIKVSSNVSGYKCYYKTVDTPQMLWFDDWVNETSGFVTLCYGRKLTAIESHSTSYDYLCTDPNRLKSADHNLPVKDNPLFLDKGDFIAISIQNSFADSVYVHGSTYNSDAIINKCNLSILSDDMTIHINKAVFTFKRVTDSTKNLDTYRLSSGSLVKNDMLYTMWSNSDAEGVVKISGEPDFVGGYHGYEEYTSLKVLKDGNVLTWADMNPILFDNLTIEVISDVYFNGTNTKAFTRIKTLIFTSDGIEIRNRWIADTNVNLSYALLEMSQCYYNAGSGRTMPYCNNSTTLTLTDPNINHPTNIMFDATTYFTTYGVVKTELIPIGKTFDQSYIQNYSQYNRIKTYFTSYRNVSLSANDELLGAFKIKIY